MFHCVNAKSKIVSIIIKSHHMKKSIAFFILIQSFVLSTQAQWNSRDKIKGNGNFITKVISVSSYDKIEVSGFFDINLTKGEPGSISIEVEENLVDYIEVEVVNGELRIGQEKGKYIVPSRSKGITIAVPFKEMNRVSLVGSGSIKSEEIINQQIFDSKLSGSGVIDLTINANEATAKVTGSGNLNLKGDTEKFNCAITGSGKINASALESKQVNASVTGSGDCKVFCKESLEARATGSGDIIYYGNPTKKDTKITGSGDIRKG